MKRLETIINSKSKTFFAFCFCFLLGVGVASFLPWRVAVPVWVVFGLLFFVGVFWKHKLARFVLVGVLLVLFGSLRYVAALPITVTDGKQVVEGVVSAEPDIRTDGVRYIVKTEETSLYVIHGLYPRFSYGDRLRVFCDVKVPEPIETFRYDMYLAKQGAFALCRDASVEVLGTGEGNALFRGVLSVKGAVAQKVNTLWHEPHASFVAGLLYGYRGGLGTLGEDFNRTGVTHIVAISGYNITIIATMLLGIFVSGFYINRKHAFWIVLVGVALFVVFAGMSASVVRAGIMGMLVLTAKQSGRLSRPGNLLMASAVIMILHNPLVLVWDAGFQLSFLATFGLVYLSPVVEKWFFFVPTVLSLRESFVATVSATVMTLPLILFQFGRLSLVSVLVNVLILWLIPWIMLLASLSVVASFAFAPFGTILAWITFVPLWYITTVVTLFSSLPFAAVDVSFPWWGVILLYGGGYWFYRKIAISK